MHLTRRSLVLLASAASVPAAPAFAQSAAQTDPRMTERSLGNANAKAVVIEYFSLTCSHCAAFAGEVLPQIKSQLIDTRKLRMVFRDVPLDRLALMAAQVARTLPAERYVPFIEALFASQNRWAFARDINYTDEMFKIAALAGMSRSTFDAAIADQALQAFILQEQQEAQDKYKIDSTPSFVVNGQMYPGERSFEEFARMAGVS